MQHRKEESSKSSPQYFLFSLLLFGGRGLEPPFDYENEGMRQRGCSTMALCCASLQELPCSAAALGAPSSTQAEATFWAPTPGTTLTTVVLQHPTALNHDIDGQRGTVPGGDPDSMMLSYNKTSPTLETHRLGKPHPRA